MLDGLRMISGLGLRIGFHAENNEIMQHLIKKALGRPEQPWIEPELFAAVRRARSR